MRSPLLFPELIHRPDAGTLRDHGAMYFLIKVDAPLHDVGGHD
jgi:hypothetical protein